MIARGAHSPPQRALNALLLSTAGLSLAKKSSTSVESAHSECCDFSRADMRLRWKMSKQKEWHGFYSEVSSTSVPSRVLGQPLFG